MLDPTVIRNIAAVRSRDAVLAVATIAGVLLVGVLAGVLVAVVVSILTLLHGVNRMPIRVLGSDQRTGLFVDIDSHPGSSSSPGLLILKPEGGLYFANARSVFDRMLSIAQAAEPPARVLIVDLSAVPDLEITPALLVDELDGTNTAQTCGSARSTSGH